MKSLKAFSLLELMVVVGLLAALTTFAVPYYADYMNRSKVALAALVLTDYDKKTMALYNEGKVTTGITSLNIDGTLYNDATNVAIDNPNVLGIIFYAPGAGTVNDNAWAFCAYVPNLSFEGYVGTIGGAYSRVCSKVVVDNGIYTRYCGSWDGGASDVPLEFLPEQCNTPNISSL